MVSHLLALVLALSGLAAYLLIGGLALGESAAFVGLFLPGETALMYGGVLAGRGNVSLPLMVCVAAVGAVLGDSVGYELGRRVGRPLRDSRLGRRVSDQRWDRAEAFLARRGGPAVLLGRWVGVLRALVPTLAGMGRMPYRRFLPWNVLGGVTWASTLVLLGYLFSSRVAALVSAVAGAGLVLTVVVAGGVAASIGWRWARHHREAARRLLTRSRRRLPGDALGATLALPLMALSFALVLDGVLDRGPLLTLDRQVLVGLTGDREPVVTGYLAAVSWVTAPVQVSVLALAVAGWLAWRSRSWGVLVAAAATLLGSGATTYLLKQLVGRPRPPLPYALVSNPEPSFPSGHTLTATALVGVLTWFALRSTDDRWARVAALSCAVGFVTLVGLSRLYLGAHWFSDVLASVPLGLAWVAAVVLWVSLRRRRLSPAAISSPA